MKHLLSIPLSMALLLCTACSDSEEMQMYGEPQTLTDSEWVNITPVYGESVAFSPIPFPDEQTLSFGDGTFTMTTRGLVQNEEATTVKMDTIVSLGTYRYEHPTLWLTMEGDGPTVEAWISASNRICFYDNDILNEFERK